MTVGQALLEFLHAVAVSLFARLCLFQGGLERRKPLFAVLACLFVRLLALREPRVLGSKLLHGFLVLLVLGGQAPRQLLHLADLLVKLGAKTLGL